MSWDLNAAKLPQAAKDFLSVLGGCGDEEQAAHESGVTRELVSTWARLPDFTEHRALALEHYRSWQGWTARQATPLDPAAPPRPDAPDPNLSFAEDGRRGLGARLRDWGRALRAGEPEAIEPLPRFIAIEEMTDQRMADARIQARAGERPALSAPSGLFTASGDHSSMPEPAPDPRDGWRPSPYGAPSSESFPIPNQ